MTIHGQFLALLGGLVGGVLGIGVWLATRSFSADGAARLDGQAWAADLVSVPSILTSGGMVAWGAYAGWRASLTAPGPCGGVALLIAALLFTAILLALSLVDLRTRRLPDGLLLVLLAWAFVQAIWLRWPTLPAAGLGLLAGGGLFLLVALFGRGAMGPGDVKLAAALGAAVGFPSILAALLLGVLAGGLAALGLLVTRRAGRKGWMAYGPYLALGAWIVWLRAVGLWP